MTTNHPAHGPVSLDRLHQIREILSKAVQSDGGNLGYAMADAVKVIDEVIAARNVETIYQVMYGECWRDITEEQYHDHVIHESPIRIVYAAPPAPVAPDECKEAPAYVKALTKDGAFIYGFNACRAAMLKSGNHTEQHLEMAGHSGDANGKVGCRLKFDQWLSQQNEPIDVDCGCVTTEAFYHWLRVAYEAGNSPVIGVDLASGPDRSVEVRHFAPPGYVMVPVEPTMAMLDEFDSIIDYGAEDSNDAWSRLIAAAPQQEVKSALEHGMQRYSGAMQKLSEGDK